MIYSDLSWFFLIFPDFSWFFLIFPDFSWFFLIFPDFSWFFLIFPDFSWFILIYSDLSLFILIYADFYWFMLIYADLSKMRSQRCHKDKVTKRCHRWVTKRRWQKQSHRYVTHRVLSESDDRKFLGLQSDKVGLNALDTWFLSLISHSYWSPRILIKVRCKKDLFCSSTKYKPPGTKCFVILVGALPESNQNRWGSVKTSKFRRYNQKERG
jgi:hypothetical protein